MAKTAAIDGERMASDEIETCDKSGAAQTSDGIERFGEMEGDSKLERLDKNDSNESDDDIDHI